ncbi:MAG: ornithine cyclodeaminase family protein, partial [Saprospiraceae bacterium]|nr:ornithine cyclodeaminase family protein [Saprospiraceae bacterium]
AELVAAGLKELGDVDIVSDLEAAVSESDVISVATLSHDPVVRGDWLRAGTHLDLVGSYKPVMRETDDAALVKGSIFIDTIHALKETGDLVIPLQKGTISENDIRGSLIELSRNLVQGRIDDKEVTVFKSVGHASEDLIAGVMAYEHYGSIF